MAEVDPKERARWIAQIREAPDDDALRLRCAKWFASHNEAQHQARAEFILTQVERARLSYDDPRHAELHQRELELLARYGTQWCAVHPGFRRPIFRRGFIEYLHLHLQDFLSHRRAVFALEPVRDVSFTGFHRAKPSLVALVAQCKELEHLHSLRLHHQGPHKDPDDRILGVLESPHLRNLRELHTTHCGFTKEGAQRFLRLHLLEQLEVLEWPACDSIDWDVHWDLQSAAKRLRTLQVSRSFTSYANLQREDWAIFLQMPRWKEFTSLTFLNGSPEEFDRVLTTQLPPNLQQLTLPAFPETATAEFVETMKALPLRSLTLWESAPRPSKLEEIVHNARWNLTHTAPGSAALELLASPVCRNLHSLDLLCDEDGLRALSQSSISAGALVRLHSDLYEQAPAAALSSFLRSPEASNLVSLSMGELESEQVIDAIVALPRLTHLHAYLRNGVSARALKAFRDRAIPWCRFRIADGENPESALQVVYHDGSARHSVPLDGYIEHTTDTVFQPQ